MTESDRLDDDTPDRLMRYGFYLVGFIDVLGQRNELREIAKMQWTDEQGLPAVKEKLRVAAGRVRKVRRALKNYFDLAAKNSTTSSQMTAEQLAELNDIRQLRFWPSVFSDSFVLSVPLQEAEHGRTPSALAVWSTLYGIAGMWIAAMAEGIPLRGAIDIGFGVDFFPKDVYGPPLLSAYELECTAQYPRVLVGGGVGRYLGYISQPKANDGEFRSGSTSRLRVGSQRTRTIQDGE